MRRPVPRVSGFYRAADEHRARLKEERERAVCFSRPEARRSAESVCPPCESTGASDCNRNTMHAWPPWMTWRPACRIECRDDGARPEVRT